MSTQISVFYIYEQSSRLYEKSLNKFGLVKKQELNIARLTIYLRTILISQTRTVRKHQNHLAQLALTN